MCLVVAYPASIGDIAHIIDASAGNFDLVDVDPDKSSFKKIQVNVEGVNGYEAIAYNVYYLDTQPISSKTLNITL